jgi:alpha-L-rhamnosidase
MANNKALNACDIGFHYLVQALTERDAAQLLFEMNNRVDVPDYGYQ